MKNLEIIIAGQRNTGKSSIMELIYRTLWVQGFDVVLNFDNDIDFKDESDFRRKTYDMREERLNVIKKEAKIIIKVLQSKCENN